MPRIVALAAAVLLCAIVQHVHAAPCMQQTPCNATCEQRCADRAFPGALTVDDKTLCLNGLGLREATVFNVNVYVAGLYLEQRDKNGERIASSDQRKLMRLRFVRDVGRSEIAEAI